LVKGSYSEGSVVKEHGRKANTEDSLRRTKGARGGGQVTVA